MIPRKKHLLIGIALARKHSNPRFKKIIKYAKNWHSHQVEVNSKDQSDTEFREWLKESYKVGKQNHLLKNKPKEKIEYCGI